MTPGENLFIKMSLSSQIQGVKGPDFEGAWEKEEGGLLMRAFFPYVVVFTLCLGLGFPSKSVPMLGHRMMVTSASQLSVDLSRGIMKKGGNVVDVAVAVGLILSVTNPRHAALGGGGFALVKMSSHPVEALDFREVAPSKTHPKYYLDKGKGASSHGPFAVGVPGFPAGLWALHRKYGKLHWSQLFDAPIKLAQKGFPITGRNAQLAEKYKKDFNPSGRRYFFKKDGSSYKPGEIWVQKNLARALKLMRNRGITSFYRGAIARDIVDSVRKKGGDLSLEDMKNYKVRWRRPIVFNYLGHEIATMPPPSSGGLILGGCLHILEGLKSHKLSPFSPKEFHYLVEVMRIHFRNRNLLGDPGFHKNPTSPFLSPMEVQKWLNKITEDKAVPLPPLSEPKNPDSESTETTHYTVMDSDGNAVSLTVTLNTNFGSKWVSEKFGIALNNEMDDFTTRPGEPNAYGLVQGSGNLVQPGKRPLSSMSPTVVLNPKTQKVVMALGASGGPFIISGVLQTLYRVLGHGDDMDRAIQAPRVHHQFRPHWVSMDPGRHSPLTLGALKKLGHKVKEGSGRAIVNGIRINEKGLLEAAYDSRDEGGASGF